MIPQQQNVYGQYPPTPAKVYQNNHQNGSTIPGYTLYGQQRLNRDGPTPLRLNGRTPHQDVYCDDHYGRKHEFLEVQPTSDFNLYQNGRQQNSNEGFSLPSIASQGRINRFNSNRENLLQQTIKPVLVTNPPQTPSYIGYSTGPQYHQDFLLKTPVLATSQPFLHPNFNHQRNSNGSLGGYQQGNFSMNGSNSAYELGKGVNEYQIKTLPSKDLYQHYGSSKTLAPLAPEQAGNRGVSRGRTPQKRGNPLLVVKTPDSKVFRETSEKNRCNCRRSPSGECEFASEWAEYVSESPADRVSLKFSYEAILQKPRTHEDEKQINHDVTRTFPDLTIYSKNGGEGHKLSNILNAIASHYPELGYIQGMNFIVASILFHVQEEYLTFWIFIHLCNFLDMKEVYKKGAHCLT